MTFTRSTVTAYVMAFGITKMKWEGEQPLFLIESPDNQQGLDPNDRQQLRPWRFVMGTVRGREIDKPK